MNTKFKYYLQKIFGLFLDYPIMLKGKITGYSLVKSQLAKVDVSNMVRFKAPFYFFDVKIGDYSYIAQNCNITNTQIGKFCSIGPNFCSGLGIHPTNGISTSPMFYSTAMQNGFSLTAENKIVESKKIIIGNDVFIGANVTVLDGVIIGNGAVIGAGAVVTKDIPPYAIAVGVPARIVKYRFENDQIERLQEIEWWNFDKTKLIEIEKYFFDLNSFVKNQRI
jgi:acetyltransferase-like isoleucine patch superfamily enzyme